MEDSFPGMEWYWQCMTGATPDACDGPLTAMSLSARRYRQGVCRRRVVEGWTVAAAASMTDEDNRRHHNSPDAI